MKEDKEEIKNNKEFKRDLNKLKKIAKKYNRAKGIKKAELKTDYMLQELRIISMDYIPRPKFKVKLF